MDNIFESLKTFVLTEEDLARHEIISSPNFDRTGAIMSDESRKAISESMKGLKRSEETKKKMSKPKSLETRKKMSKPKSAVTKKKMSASKKGLIPWNKGVSGIQKPSDESRKKMSESALKRWNKVKNG